MKRSLWVRISLALVVVLVMQLVLAASVSASAPTEKPAAGGGRWHLVRWGETLYSIGRMYGVSYWAIAQANGITNPNRIYAGTWLYIHASTSCATGTRSPRSPAGTAPRYGPFAAPTISGTPISSMWDNV